MNQVQEQQVEEFIVKLRLEPGQYVKKDVPGGNGYQLDAILPNDRKLRFGSVRCLMKGRDAGKLTVYAVKGFFDPEERFKCQKQNNKHCWYRFSLNDEDATKYAVRAVKSAYGNKVR